LRYTRRLPQMLRAFDHAVFLGARVDRVRFYDHWTLERCGGPGWSMIPNGTRLPPDAGEGRAFRERHGLGGAFVFLCVGVYDRAKGQEAVLRAFLKAGLPDAALVFIGNELNDYSRRCAALAQGRGNVRVLFLEKQSRADIRAAYRACTSVVLASRGETQPLVLLDAMACGKPFLSTDVGCVSEFPGGLIVRNEAELAAHMGRFRTDAALCERLGQAGLEACRTTYDWERVIDAHDALLRRLIAHPGNRPE
jgi:glycosyltransferase involved in cell wall biosynthesis